MRGFGHADPAQDAHPRERARVEFTRDIKQVARRQLAEVGAAALSLRAVSRELGLASPSALYRYFPGRDALLTALIVDSYAAVSEAAESAAGNSPTGPPSTAGSASATPSGTGRCATRTSTR
ncbi:hypothetical protein GCM10025734_71250 [Kitasatospora paranensis]|uniref:TetR/AcrR family transcriptional regulator n=1 Tax=Kitasatospora paranensis TaxID=258053 RepID=UPI0031EAE57A